MKLFDRLGDATEAEHVVWIGYDPLEDVAAKMLAHSIRSGTKMKDLKIIPIVRDELLAHDLCNRPIDPNGSTQFSITRFMVPHLMGYNGIGIFLDCDMLITRDIKEMFDLFDPLYAVQVCKHEYTPSSDVKMGGLPQSSYPRKNWSASMIYNCNHMYTKRLTQPIVETSSPKYLHRFEWLPNGLIGGLPLEFNFLVGEQEDDLDHHIIPFNIHHTLGAPIFRDCQDVPYADYWKSQFYETFGRKFNDTDIIN